MADDSNEIAYDLLSSQQCQLYPPNNLPRLLDDQLFFIMHFNTRSLVKNLPKLTDLLSYLPKLPNVIAISETKLTEDRENLIQISNY